jgi:1,4-dihydroxy-2-naphthoate octaprenyltransferase
VTLVTVIALAFLYYDRDRDWRQGRLSMRVPLGQGRAAAVAGIVIMALMIEGTIDVVVDDAWLWGLLALFIVCLFSGHRGRRPWEQRWWWDDFVGTKESDESSDD